ncbi:histidyl-tRNA synthetase [Austwickia chelonae]|uniref:Histidine--tRNA ligase n=1 Tax=Austwickia chelonae NBRC 105200 TaxID=1184607 RepID=K6W6Q5_9MICO|nr:histidine--tRNA ligase [Austwickia chelonae]GAB77492.1 histidyl-tRNA synthetase [Austwickia chelonae NBRC 105200]SEW11465.1 histidyl-tRNA synthetase [Austwickia chelonae]
MNSQKITPLSGFPEWLPEQRIVEQHFLDVIRATFESHGFVGIETRAVEPVSRLLGKGGDADKEIYGVNRLAAKEADQSREDSLGLHFDLTVPFARYVLENSGRLVFPFRRYQIQKVWRGERPQDGRFREFTQADIDIVDAGELPFHYEVELPLVIADAFSKLPIGPFRIQVNNRRVPEGFYLGLGIPQGEIVTVLRIVDKLDKVGPEVCSTMLVEAGRTPEQAAHCLALAAISSSDSSFVDRVRALGVVHPVLEEGLSQLSAVMDAAAEHAPGLLVADLKVARGLDYYTGTVYETQLIGQEAYGSVCSGGRYDALAADGRTTYPGVGISIGVSRLVAKLMPTLVATRRTPSVVLISLAAEDGRADAMRIASSLRARGIACEVAPSAAKFGKQIKFADRRGIPFVWFPEWTDADGGLHPASVKDIRSGEQVEADPEIWEPPVEDLFPQVVSVL